MNNDSLAIVRKTVINQLKNTNQLDTLSMNDDINSSALLMKYNQINLKLRQWRQLEISKVKCLQSFADEVSSVIQSAISSPTLKSSMNENELFVLLDMLVISYEVSQSSSKRQKEKVAEVLHRKLNEYLHQLCHEFESKIEKKMKEIQLLKWIESFPIEKLKISYQKFHEFFEETDRRLAAKVALISSLEESAHHIFQSQGSRDHRVDKDEILEILREVEKELSGISSRYERFSLNEEFFDELEGIDDFGDRDLELCSREQLNEMRQRHALILERIAQAAQPFCPYDISFN